MSRLTKPQRRLRRLARRPNTPRRVLDARDVAAREAGYERWAWLGSKRRAS